MMKNLFLLTLSFCPFLLNGQNFSGTYTIGGSSPNYPTFNAALTAIGSGTVTGAVTFNVRPGVYPESIQLKLLNGSSEVNTITFKSENGDASAVVIKAPGGAQSTVDFQSGAHYVLQKLTIVHDFVNNGRAVNMVNSTAGSNIVLDQCRILEDSLYTPGTSNHYGIYISAYRRVVVKDCFVNGGRIGIYASGSIADIQLLNNKVTQAYETGVFVGGTPVGILLDGNYIRMRPALNRQRAYGFQGSVVEQAVYRNNMIAGGFQGTVLGYGFYSPNANADIGFYNNSILYDGEPNVESMAFYLKRYLTYTTRFLNNIFANMAQGYAFVFDVNSGTSTDADVVCDYNCFYTNGSRLTRWNNLVGNNLAQHRSNSNKDLNSIQTWPGFVNASDLHTFNPALNGKAQTLPEVLNDFDKQPRNASTPDIGADEFTPNSTDLSVFKIQISESDTDYYLKRAKIFLRNEGTSSLNGKSAKFSWSVDSGKTWTTPEDVTLSGLANYGDTTHYTFSAALNQPFPGRKQYCARLESGSLAGDAVALNNKICADYCNQLRGGSFIIGKEDADFSSLTEAVDFLRTLACPLLGSVDFAIRPGIYIGKVEIPVIPGITEADRVRFYSITGNASDVIIRDTSTTVSAVPYVVRFKGARYVTLQDVSIHFLNQSKGGAIHFTEQARDIKIKGVHIIMDSTIADSGQRSGLLISHQNNSELAGIADKIVVEDCVVRNGNYGFYGIGSNANSPDSRIINSAFLNQTRGGILIRNYLMPEILGNRVELKPVYATTTGISLSSIVGNINVSNNTIRYVGSVGIDLQQLYFSDTLLISNNMIGGGFNPKGLGIGILANACINLHLYHNSIAADAGMPGFSTAFYAEEGENLHMKNNIFSGASYGLSVTIKTPSMVASSDFNCFQTESDTLLYWGAYKNNLDEHRSATPHDASSMEVLPQFTSKWDLHLKGNNLKGKGTPLALVKWDIDGEPRDPLKPDIGADEYYPVGMNTHKMKTFRVYPNPAKTEFWVEGTPGLGFELVDLRGQIVGRGMIGEDNSVEDLTPGMYWVRIRQEGWSMPLLIKGDN